MERKRNEYDFNPHLSLYRQRIKTHRHFIIRLRRRGIFGDLGGHSVAYTERQEREGMVRGK